MSNIKFYIPEGVTIPLVLRLDVDGTDVTYRGVASGFEFTVWHVDREKAVGIVQEIVKQIKSEHDDLKHGVTWVTTSLEITAVNERYGYVCVTWEYRIRDAG